MIFFKYLSKISTTTLPICLCLTLFYNPIVATDISPTDDELDALYNSITTADLATLRSCEPGESQAWISLMDTIKFPKILDQSFYTKTSIPNNRNIIHLPNFQLCTYQPLEEHHQFTIHAFYNQTGKKCFTTGNQDNDGNRIGSYLNLENKEFVKALNAGLEALPLSTDLAPLKKINFPDVLYLCAQARLEERRMGFLAHYCYQHSEETSLECKIPLLWMIKNLNFTAQEKAQIKEEFSAFTKSDFNEDQFTKKHVIMDALGTGTCELSISKKFLEKPTWSLDLGACLYLPTDFHFKEGLYGTYITPTDQQPVLDFCNFVNNITSSTRTVNPDLANIVSNYFVSALDHLSSMVLQCPLGNDQALGFGIKVAPKWNIHENLQYNGLYVFEVFTPQDMPKFFVPILSGAPFSEALAASTLSYDDKLDLIETTLTQRLFPRVFTTKVLPGFVINSTSNLQKTYKNWNFTIGYNNWYKYQETFFKISTPPTIDLQNFDIQKAISPQAWAMKVFGKIHHIFEGKRHSSSLSLWADATLFNSTIGNDYTIGISCDIAF